MKSRGEELLDFQLRSYSLPFVREFIFHPTRKWRFDFAYLPRKLAIEVEGGIYSKGRHTRPKGYQNDMEKYNAASALGWTLLRFTPEQVKKGIAVLEIRKFLGVSA